MNPKVIIDGIEYVQKTEIQLPTDEKLKVALRELVGIQFWSDQSHKHRAWAWDALNALSPTLAAMDTDDAYGLVNDVEA